MHVTYALTGRAKYSVPTIARVSQHFTTSHHTTQNLSPNENGYIICNMLLHFICCSRKAKQGFFFSFHRTNARSLVIAMYFLHLSCVSKLYAAYKHWTHTSGTFPRASRLSQSATLALRDISEVSHSRPLNCCRTHSSML